MSSIEWTDETWNPTVGCSKVSPGCDNCYAIRVAAREMQDAHRGLTVPADDEGGPEWTGEVRCLPERLDTPLRWRKPRRVFVDSMSDLFHPSVPDEFIAEVFTTMGCTPQHTYQVLTKRPRRMAELLARWEHDTYTRDDGIIDDSGTPRLPGDPWPLPNVIGMTSVEDQHQADRRIPHLIAAPLAMRGLSAEPLLGPIDLDGHIETMSPEDAALPCPIDWCIVGGESGPGARPMHPEWARSLRDQCVAAGVPFFFKQWGEWGPSTDHSNYLVSRRRARYEVRRFQPDGTPYESDSRKQPDVHGPGGFLAPGSESVMRVGKKAAGRELDGRTWDQFPERAEVAA